MGQLLSFSSLRVPPAIARGLRRRSTGLYVGEVGRIDGEEVPLGVEFVGLSESEQRRALAAFPGGKRFYLVTERARTQG
jgi:hypothetical protein